MSSIVENRILSQLVRPESQDSPSARLVRVCRRAIRSIGQGTYRLSAQGYTPLIVMAAANWRSAVMYAAVLMSTFSRWLMYRTSLKALVISFPR
jgi:hypothetical protein